MGQALTRLRMFVDQTFPPKPTFGVGDIPDLTGEVVIITGGHTSLGPETVHVLLPKNAKVYIAGRSKSKAETAINKLKDETGKEALFLELDLANLKAVKKAAEEFMSKETQLHVLFNSGGVYRPPIEQLTVDGYDLQFGTNVLGHFYFTKLLLPVLFETAKSAPDKHVRLVTTSSVFHMFHGPGILYDTLDDSPARKSMSTQALYNQSKYGNVLFARDLARRYGDQWIISTSFNPGNCKTEAQRHRPSLERRILNAMVLYPAPLGPLTQLYAGISPVTKDLNGAYFIP